MDYHMEKELHQPNKKKMKDYGYRELILFFLKNETIHLKYVNIKLINDLFIGYFHYIIIVWDQKFKDRGQLVELFN